MVKDARTNTSRICSAKENGAKIARLHYDTVPDHSRLFSTVSGSSSSVDVSLSSQSQECHETELEIHLDTGPFLRSNWKQDVITRSVCSLPPLDARSSEIQNIPRSLPAIKDGRQSDCVLISSISNIRSHTRRCIFN